MINLNGKIYSGNNVSVINGKVIIDGKVVDGDDDKKVINITVEGNIENLEINSCDDLKVTGDCGSVVLKNGNIRINGNVGGDVTNKNGNIMCGNVDGSVETKIGDITHS